MTMPPLPAEGDTSWYAWAQSIDAMVRSGGGGGDTTTPTPDATDPDLFAFVTSGGGDGATPDPSDPDLYTI